ncbi:MAG: hypothetical protein AAF942_09290 [Pseudomonadota bacterium]
MILETLEYLTTRCSPPARRLGYLKEAIAIKARHRRNCEVWGPHLARSRAFILAAADACARQRTVLVLGSGLLLDIPLGALSAGIDRVLHVDMIHLRRARRVAASYPNVSFHTEDITGLAATFGDRVRDGWRGDPVPGPTSFHDLAEVDLVISANVAAQLPVMPAATLRRAGAEAEQVRGFCRAVVEAHLAYLDGFRAPVCLVTETDREIHGPHGDLLRLEDALFGVRLPELDASWTWDMAPVGEASAGYGIRNRIAAFSEFRRHPRTP